MVVNIMIYIFEKVFGDGTNSNSHLLLYNFDLRKGGLANFEKNLLKIWIGHDFYKDFIGLMKDFRFYY